MNKQKRERRNKLFKKDPYCTYCNCKLIHPKDIKSIILPENMATIDHIIERTDPNKYKKVTPKKANTVLACVTCNREKAAITQKYFNKLFIYKVIGTLV